MAEIRDFLSCLRLQNNKNIYTMSADSQWYVTQGEQQFGPYNGAQLAQYAVEGNIAPDSLVWTEGMTEWLPAKQIQGLFPNAAIAQASPRTNIQASRTNPTAAFGTKTTTTFGAIPAMGVNDPYPNTGIKPASFATWLGLFVGGITLILIAILLFVKAGAAIANEAQAGGEVSTALLGGMGIATLLIVVGALLNTISVIPMYMYLYRAWLCLQPGGFARTTPGVAIGYLFIPFFNLYWIFQAFLGLAKDWNKTVNTYSDLKTAPRMPEGIFLTFCIGCFIFPLAMVMIFPVMSRICEGINFFAFRVQAGHSALGARPGGGLTYR